LTPLAAGFSLPLKPAVAGSGLPFRGARAMEVASEHGAVGPAWPRQIELFRLVLLALLIGQMFVYYDTAPKTIPHITEYLLVNLALIVLTLIPWARLTQIVWWLLWPVGALLRLDWATRGKGSDVYWATSQGVHFLLHGMNPYTHVPTWVYDHQATVGTYPTYSYFPGSLFPQIPFYLLGNVRLGLALADIGTAILLYLIARPRLGIWPARAVAAFWLIFVPGFQVALLLSILDFYLLFWIALVVWCYLRGNRVASALAAGMAIATKQYGFLFGIPWLLLLARPLLDVLIARWREVTRGRGLIADLPRRLWSPPAACIGLAALIVSPFAALSPQAFVDATYFHHANKLPRPMLGTPQWNQSLPAQFVSLGWFSLDRAKTVATLALAVAVVAVLIAAVFKVRDVASALRYAALLAGAFFAFSGGDVQFFYWRVPLFLLLLAFVVGWTNHENRGDAESAEGRRESKEVDDGGMTSAPAHVLLKR
jgi:hypothetical protein